MLKTAQKYAMQLSSLQFNIWHDPNYMWINSSPGFGSFGLSEDTERIHEFVSVDKDGNVLGYIGYEVDWVIKSAYRLVAINFDRGNVIFAKDLYEAVVNIFEKFNLNRLCWSSIADNPAVRGYRNFAKKFGGRECGYFKQESMLQDGKLYDRVYFEILADDYFKAKKKKKRIK